jgi:hypothetical protein
MDEASKLLEDMTVPQPQLLAAYHKITLDPPVLDGMVNPVPSLVNPIDHVINMVTSLVEPVEKVVSPIPSSLDPIPPSVDTNLPLEGVTQAVNLFPPIDPILPLESETQAFDSFPSIDPILPLENETQLVDLISSSFNPTLPLESKLDTAHVFLVDTKSIVLGGIPSSLMEPPPSNESIHFNWGVLTGPCLPSHIPFHITIQVCG